MDIKLFRIGALASVAVLLPGVALAQVDFPTLVRGYLTDRAGSEIPDYALQGQPMVGSLNTNGRQNRVVRLSAGVNYAFMAACDDDCTDVDLYLSDRRGNVLDSDEADDDFPVVFFTPEVTANYQIGVRMFTCSSEPCYYAVGRFTAN